MKRTAMIVAALLISACSTKEYVFTPPDTAEGRACVAQCQARETSCRREQDRRAAVAQEACEAESARREDKCEIQASVEYVACLKFARTDEDRKACVKQDCTQPSCAQSGNYGLCSSDYRVCFQSCGGTIGVIEH